jgi:hypothetical protein
MLRLSYVHFLDWLIVWLTALIGWLMFHLMHSWLTLQVEFISRISMPSY